MAVPMNPHVSSLLSQRDDNYTLPTELIRKRAALAALDRAMRSESVSGPASLGFGTRTEEDEIRQAISGGLIEAALSGAVAAAMDAEQATPLDLEPLLRYRERVALAADRYSIVQSAARSLAAGLEAGVRGQADEIITEHLAPAIAECMDQARPLVEALGEREPSRSGLYDAPQQARDAFDALTLLAERYGRVRAAYRHVRSLLTGNLEQDWRRTLLSEFRQQSLALAWPQWNDIRHDSSNAATVYPTLPWPEDPVGRLAWIVRSGVDVWVPTPAELAALDHVEADAQSRLAPVEVNLGRVADAETLVASRASHVPPDGSEPGR
jgi:hypothetical protein